MQEWVDTAIRETDKLIEAGKVPKAADYIVDSAEFSPTPNSENPNRHGQNVIEPGPINRGRITIYPPGATSLREAFITYGHELGHFNRNWTGFERVLDRYGEGLWQVYQGGTYGGPRP